MFRRLPVRDCWYTINGSASLCIKGRFDFGMVQAPRSTMGIDSMSSSSRLSLAAVLLLTAQSILSSQSAPAASPLTCPASIKAVKSEHKFERPSIYNGTPGKQEYELAPDNTQTQGKQVRETWNLADYRDMNLFVRCRYLGTAATVDTNIPAPLKTCIFSFHNVSGNEPVASPVFQCK
jgi:hypothetical protein